MFGNGHILQTAAATHREIVPALYLYAMKNLQSEEGEFAGSLAAAVAMSVLGKPPIEPKHEQFHRENADRIQIEIEVLCRDSYLCEVLSGAVYNIGYGYYVDAGGSRILNKFLAFIRLEGNLNSASDSKILQELCSELNAKDVRIIQGIQTMKRNGMWRSRSNNPNEVEHYQAAHTFAAQMGVPFR